jgi:zinc protease
LVKNHSPLVGWLRSARWFACIVCLAGALCVAGGADYAVVVSARTAGDAAWRRVADTLVKRHQADLVVYTNSVVEVLPALQRIFPRYACFVATPAEASREFVAQVHQITRRLDDDPYTDCFWGILTGYDVANALAIARQSEPLTIRKVASGTELAMDMVEQGVWFCELNRNKMVRKEKGGAAQVLKGPNDTTESLVQALNDGQPDLFVTSGHATERDWMIGFRYRNGFFKHKNGQLFGEDTARRILPVNSPNPKVYLPIGNCLMGHIDQTDCMATSWMNSAGVCQMLGYTKPTWYGYAAWGVLDYFVEQPGRYSFTEAFFANQHALIHRLATYFPAALDPDARTAGVPTSAAKAAGLGPNDGRGLLYDRDIVAFYGDPAWVARMADMPRAFEQSLTESKGTFTFEIKPNRGRDSFKPLNTNGSQRGGRPFIAFLPFRVRDVKVVAGAELNPVVTDDFILVPNPGVCDLDKPVRVVFTASRMR